MCDDYFPKLRKIFSFKKPKKIKKANILSVFILALCVGLFFSVVFESDAHSEAKNYPEEISGEMLDPMRKIGKRSIGGEDVSRKICNVEAAEMEKERADKEKELSRAEYADLVESYPIEAMVPYISKKEKTVAAFLIGIAKKESDWGKHSPKKNGRDCYNYWGYKGGYNLTASGYSCFDNPEQAVAMVGGRIEELVGKKINTPERMVVWKCGSSCAGHDPGGVRKWISDVGSYFYKLNS